MRERHIDVSALSRRVALLGAVLFVIVSCGGNDATHPRISGALLRQLAEPIFESVSANPDIFAGAYLDRAQTVINVLFVGEEEVARTEVDRVTDGASLPIAWQQVEYSGSALSDAKLAVIDFWETMPRNLISEVAVDVERNRVRVGIPHPNQALADELRQRFGDIVVIAIVPPDTPA